jgi:hypothetical protein
MKPPQKSLAFSQQKRSCEHTFATFGLDNNQVFVGGSLKGCIERSFHLSSLNRNLHQNIEKVKKFLRFFNFFPKTSQIELEKGHKYYADALFDLLFRIRFFSVPLLRSQITKPTPILRRIIAPARAGEELNWKTQSVQQETGTAQTIVCIKFLSQNPLDVFDSEVIDGIFLAVSFFDSFSK